jgi:TonB family protein
VEPAKPAAPAEPSAAAPAASPDQVLTRVLPEIPAKARNTIRGKVNVNVKVSVDEAGNVRDAALEPPRSSAYLSNLTRQAALRWKFQPAGGPQEWLLRFQLFRDQTKVSSSRVE